MMKVPFFCEYSIERIIRGYEDKEFSPKEVAQECAERVSSLEQQYQAWVHFDQDKLMDASSQIEKRLKDGEAIRALDGIPVGVKDIFNTIDFPTEMGSPIWNGFTPGNDARVVHQIKMAGGVIPGKTVTAEFAVHTLGKTINPHDPARSPGTSSSGSAVAIATGMVPVAIGTQTAGSIVRPASFCGVYGCKPSFGLVPRTGMLKTTDSLDTVGFFVAHPEDLKRVWDVVSVHGLNYPISHRALSDFSRQNKPETRPWKVAIARTHVFNLAETYAQESFLAFSRKLSEVPGIEVFEIDLPDETKRAHEVHANIYDKSLAYYFKEEYKRAELVSPIMNSLIEHGQQINNEVHQRALRDQEIMARKMDHLLSDYDIMISLSTAGAAPLREVTEVKDPALMWTMTHLPVVSAPVFQSPEGLPFGLQLIARRYNDPLLFNFISYLQMNELLPSGPSPLLPI